MNKKLLSLIMAIAMIASLAIPAFADDPPEGTVTGDLVYTANTANPVVKVTMPSSATSGDIILNPYGMSVTPAGGSASTTQIISATRFITNRTPAPMKVGVTATAIYSGDAIASSKPCTGKETTKSAYMILEFQNSTTSGSEPAANTWNLVISGDTISGDTINEKLYPQIVPTEEGKNAPGIMSVPAASDSAPKYIGIKVFGNLAGTPTDAWTSNDTATVSLEFTFTPAVKHKATATGVTVASTLTGTTYGGTAEAVMGTYVRVQDTNGKMPVVTDADGNDVAVTQAFENNAQLYYFTMPATDVTVKAGT